MSFVELVDAMQPVLVPMRAVNPVLATVAVMLLGFRLGPALVRYWMAAREGLTTPYQTQERNARLIFCGYVVAAGLGSAQAIALDNKAGPVTILLFGLHLGLIWTMIKWKTDHPLEGTK